MGPNPNVFCCGFQSGLAQVTVQVATSTPLSRLHPCRDINLNPCSLQLMSSDVATSISCRDFSSSLLQPATDVHDVATSISCRDISLCPWRFHWLLSVSRLQSSVATTASVKSSSFFQTCHSFKAILMLRPQLPCRDISSCRDITMLSRHHSLSFWLILSCLSGDSCRDLLLISFNYLDVATS